MYIIFEIVGSSSTCHKAPGWLRGCIPVFVQFIFKNRNPILNTVTIKGP